MAIAGDCTRICPGGFPTGEGQQHEALTTGTGLPEGLGSQNVRFQ